jgi:hypothetical protein
MGNSDFLLSSPGSSNPASEQVQASLLEFCRGSTGRASHRSDHEGNLNTARPQTLNYQEASFALALARYQDANGGINKHSNKHSKRPEGNSKEEIQSCASLQLAWNDMVMDLDTSRTSAPPSVSARNICLKER